jgi:hypothetical protein
LGTFADNFSTSTLAEGAETEAFLSSRRWIFDGEISPLLVRVERFESLLVSAEVSVFFVMPMMEFRKTMDFPNEPQNGLQAPYHIKTNYVRIFHLKYASPSLLDRQDMAWDQKRTP